MAVIATVGAYLLGAFWRVAYVIRPYDMLADRRRWFWQARQKCGWWG